MSAIPDLTLAWLEAAVGPGARIMRVTDLPPASHSNHRVGARTRGGAELDLLLRRFTSERLGDDPWYDPAAELQTLRSLEALEAPGFAVPGLVAEDALAAACDVPTLLVTWMAGAPPSLPPRDVAAFARELAYPLPEVHAIAPPASMRRYEPYFASDGLSVVELRPPAWSSTPSVWERAFATLAADPPPGPPRFIHRDYYHGNTVWADERLTAVIDWTTGCVGPLGIDLAQARINLAWDLDLAAADRFLDAWREVGGDPGAFHPYWDLLDAVDWLGDGTADPEDDPAALDRYETFVAGALAELG